MRSADPTDYTDCYSYKTAGAGKNARRELYCEGVAVAQIARAVGTPAYVYSRASLELAYRRLDSALRNSMGSAGHAVCYAMKANSNLSVLQVLAQIGSSFDIVSGGELDRLRRIGVPGQRIVYSGVGKTRDEIREALDYRAESGVPASRKRRAGSSPPGATAPGIYLLNVESEEELEVLAEEAARRVERGGHRVAAAIRVNPDVLAGGHRHISTGHHRHKFGVSWERARRMYRAHQDSRWIHWHGISAHIGSQIVTLAPYRRALRDLAQRVRTLAREGIAIECVDCGGGLGIRYDDERPVDPRAFARMVAAVVRPLGCRALIEPGRTIAGPAGVLLTHVTYTKENGGKRFLIADAGMNDLMRPVLYDAHHPITKTVQTGGARTQIVDVVGPVCETGDYLGRGVRMEEARAGDLLAIWAAGAYGFSESSNYNGRPRAAEVLVDGARWRVIRERETRHEMVRGELSAATEFPVRKRPGKK
ncbi:MAG: diaminopimelate decarboxylase [Candidatus Acidiferrales bacterium]